MAQERAHIRRQGAGEAGGNAEWNALRDDLDDMIGEDGAAISAGNPASSPTTDAHEFLDHINALRAQLKQQNERVAPARPAAATEARMAAGSVETRGAETGRNPVGESLQSAIDKIRAGQKQAAARRSDEPMRAGPAVNEVVEMTARLSDRVTSLEALGDKANDPVGVSQQLGLLTETVGQLAQLVRKSGDTGRLESKLAEFLTLERQDPVIESISQRLERLNESVRKLADIQVKQVRRPDRAPAGEASSDIAEHIESSMRRMYDRLDTLERSMTVAPEEMERLAAGVHTLAQALEKEGRSATISDELIARINAVAAHVESLEPAQGSTGFADLKTELATLRRYMVEAFEPRFDTLEDQIKDLSVRLTGAEDAMGRELLEEQMRLFNAKMDNAAGALDEIGRSHADLSRRLPDMGALVDLIAAKTATEVNAMKPTDTIGVSNIAVAAMRESIAQVDRRLDNLQDTLKRLAKAQNGAPVPGQAQAPQPAPARPAAPIGAPEAASHRDIAFDEPAPIPQPYAPAPRSEIPPKPVSTLGRDADDVFKRAAEKAMRSKDSGAKATLGDARETSPVSRESFIEAARRAAQRSTEPSVLDANGGFLGKALARLKRKSADDPEAPEAVSEPVASVGVKQAVPAEPAADTDEVVIEEADARQPDANEQHEGFLSRHRRPILLGASFVAVALMTMNLIGQRMSATQGETIFEVADTGEPAVVETVAEAQPLEATEMLVPNDVRVVGALASAPAEAIEQALPAANTAEEVLAFAGADTAVDPVTTASIDPASLDISVGPGAMRDAAIAGDPHAQFEIAAIYTEGQVIPQDYVTAAIWYERSASAGFAPSQYRLGNLYENGRGVTLDLQAARRWYEAAAQAGNRMAMHNLAALYAGGALDSQDFASAALWFEKAANLGVKDSQFNLGMLYARGLGVPQDFVKSYMWFELAAQTGDQDAATARDDIARSLDANALELAQGMVANWRIGIVDIAANYAPIGTWDANFDAGIAIGDPEIIAQVQEILGKLGYDIGTPDGVIGPKTEIAIRAFESATGMNETGRINPRLLAVLGSQPV